MSDFSNCHEQAASFDWATACYGEANATCIKKLHSLDPYSIFLALDSQRLCRYICLRKEGPSFLIPASVGLHDFRLGTSGLDAAYTFANFMLAPENRNALGHLVTDGIATPGYNNYDQIVVDLKKNMQASRTTLPPKDSRGSNYATTKFIERTPGLLGILQEVLSHFGVDLDNWKPHVAAFHGLIADASKQTAFAWHSDVEDLKGLKRNAITVIVQCSDDITAMRIFGCAPFFFENAGHVAVFFGRLAHQSIPWIDPVPEGRRVCKAVFFLYPEDDVVDLLEVACKESQARLGNRLHYKLDWNGAHERDVCLRFVLERCRLEFQEAKVAMPEEAELQTTESSTITCITHSALSSLWQAIKQHVPFGTYGAPQFFIQWSSEDDRSTQDGAGRVTGIVWYSRGVRGNPQLAYLYCIAALPGKGKLLHNEFCSWLAKQNCKRLEAPMALCRTKRAPWLLSLGWNAPPAPLSKKKIQDGDVLFLNLESLKLT